MNILMIGDSWGTGAFDIKNFHDPSHPGLAYFLNQNHTVTNLSVRGGSNGIGIYLIENFLKEYPKPDLLVWVQANFMRDARNYLEGVNRNPTREGIEKLNINWNASTIDDILLPYFTNTCEAIQQFDIPTISVGASAKVHPKIMEYFNGIPISATELVTQDFEDSYFENRLDIEMFSKQYLRSTKVQLLETLDLWNTELSIFLNKYDLWQNSPYIIEQHGNLRLHKRLYEEVEKLL
jgi:hypothetical protein